MNFNSITSLIKKFLEKYGFNYNIEIGEDFAFYYEQNLITYSLVVTERMDKMFLNFAFENGLEYDCGIFLLSLFHEIGHDITYNNYNHAEFLYYAISQEIKADLTDSDEDCKIYMNLYDEKQATLWAIKFINSHYSDIKIFAEKLQNEINNFYKNYKIITE